MPLATIEELKQGRAAIAVVGLGYVGLPLAVALGRHFKVIGFDISDQRIQELKAGHDHTLEVSDEDMRTTTVDYTSDQTRLAEARCIIIAVPTPIDDNLNPDLQPLASATDTVGRYMPAGCLVSYESTVYPGLTEEYCVPLLERTSGLVAGHDFWVGYSPERINPGDKKHTLSSIVKVVSAQNAACTELMAYIYGSVVSAGVHKAPSIKVAEAAKVIENTQRDINIALMNELAMLFHRMGIDTPSVLEAAGTKWNFLPFRPGLVGGHCIGVDPYYLTFKARSIGFHPQVISAGRRINDEMGRYVATQTVKQMAKVNSPIHGARVGIMGLTFKENVPDLRNTRVIDIVAELKDYGMEVLVADAMADAQEAQHEYGLNLVPQGDLHDLDALIVAVAHEAYATMPPEALKACFRDQGRLPLMDVKSVFDPDKMRQAGFTYWRL